MSERVIARIDLNAKQEIPLDASVECDALHGVVFYDNGLDEFGYFLQGIDGEGDRHEGEDLTYGFDTKEEVIDEMLSNANL